MAAGGWVWFPVCPLSEVNLYSSRPSGAGGLSAVRRLEVSVSRRLEIHYLYGRIDRCHGVCPLYGGCPHLGGSVNGGSTVVILVLCLSSSGFNKCCRMVQVLCPYQTLKYYVPTQCEGSKLILSLCFVWCVCMQKKAAMCYIKLMKRQEI